VGLWRDGEGVGSMMRIFGILGEVMDDHARAYELMKKGR